MLRWATIASLVALNLSIWYGPFESIRATTTAGDGTAQSTTTAELLAHEGNLDAALTAYRDAVSARPEDPTAHFEYALFCYMYADYLRDEAGWRMENIVLTVRDGFYRARRLAPDNFELASQYALYLMDTEFFGQSVSRDQTLEAWDHVIALIQERHSDDPAWPFFTEHLSYALLQRARTESRYGETANAEATLAEVRKLSPEFRIPTHLE
ncbi:MAG: tetratricopeptide repeat protein [Candidatus Hydrogenedentes bacterium]|nr:tetratricopeptide repeat protein [Candidatus Hydrogenedentota bacterium]